MKRSAIILAGLLIISLLVACTSRSGPEMATVRPSATEVLPTPAVIQPKATESPPAPAKTSGNGQEGKPRNAILIGWDGAQRDHVKEALNRGELPNLERLASEGALVAIDIVGVTDTKAGWTQILTGYRPEVTGVFSNSRYRPIPHGYTIFERLERYFGPEDFATVAVIGKKGNVDADPPERRPVLEGDRIEGEIVVEGDTKYQLIPGKPFCYTKDSMDLFLNGLSEDKKVGSRAMALLEQYRDKPFFFFVHFTEVDWAGHGYGEDSQEYNDALISADTWTGRIMEKLKELKIYEETLIYVTADHGFDEGMKTHGSASYVFLGTNDPQVMRQGERTDIAPTILARLGLDLGQIEPPLDGRPLTNSAPPLW